MIFKRWELNPLPSLKSPTNKGSKKSLSDLCLTGHPICEFETLKF